jgi:hypothetical protein
MATERTVHREVTEETVQPAGQPGAGSQRVVEETVTETETVQPAVVRTVPVVPVQPVQPIAPPATNVTVHDDSGGSVSINTPDGTQVNVTT